MRDSNIQPHRVFEQLLLYFSYVKSESVIKNYHSFINI